MRTRVQHPFIALVWLVLPALVQAQFTFTTNNGAITITGYNTAAGLNVVIPSMTNGYPVTSIGNGAFEYSGITGVTIPNSVTSIGSRAFEFCTSLTGVTIPNSVTNIGSGAFEYCALTSVIILNSVTSIGTNAFYNCTSLTSVIFPSSLTSIGPYAFANCTKLTSTYFQGNAPPDPLNAFYQDFATDSVYYLAGTTGWGPTFCGRPALLWNPQAHTFSFTGG